MPEAALGRALGARRRRAAPAGERALIDAAARGSAEAVAELFRAHWPRAHRVAWLVIHDAAAAEDVVQETLVRAWKHSEALSDGSRSVRGWLLTVARNIVTPSKR